MAVGTLGPRDRRQRRDVQRREHGAAGPAAVRQRRSARLHRRHRAGLGSSRPSSASRASSSSSTRSSRSCSRTSRSTTRSRPRCAPAIASSASACRRRTSSLFTTLGAKPILGRLPVAADEDRVAVISHALWKSWFGGDPNVIGQTSSTSAGNDRTVVGVMGPEFSFPIDDTLLWISSDIRAEGIEPGPVRRAARRADGARRHARGRRERAHARSPSRLPERFGGSANYARDHRAASRGRAPAREAAARRRGRSALGAVRRRRRSCCSSRAPTSPICSWCAPRDGSATSRFAARSAPRAAS